MLNIFSIFDTIASAHITPFYLPNPEMAMRAFADSVRDPEHAFNRNPEDYFLMHHGVFDPQTGEFEIFDIPKTLVKGAFYYKEQAQKEQAQ